MGSDGPDQGDPQQVFGRSGYVAETVLQFITDTVKVFFTGNGGDLLVGLQLLDLIHDVGFRNEGVHVQMDGNRLFGRRFFAFGPADRFAQQLAVEVVADSRHMAVLGPAQDAAGPADLQIPHGDPEAAAHVGEFPDGGKAFFRHFPQDPVPLVHQEGVGGTAGPADTAPQLIELGQAHPVGVTDDNGIDVGNIHTGLNNSGRDQDIDPAADKIIHEIFQLGFGHTAMAEFDPGLRNQLAQPVRDQIDIVDPVMDVIDLSPAGQLPDDGFPDHLFIVFHDIGLDGDAAFRGFLQQAHIPDPDQAHMEGPGNRRGGQGQDIHILPQFFDLFLVGDAEALLLVDHQQAKVFKMNIFGQQAVGADDDIAHAAFQVLQGLFLLGRRPETGEQADIDRVGMHPFGKGAVMLLGQDGRGDQNCHLLAVLDCLESGPDGDFRFAEAHVAADQAVHDLIALHVLFGIFDGLQLVSRFGIREELLELMLPDRILFKGMSFALAAGGVEFDQIVGHFFNGPPDFALGVGPFLAAKTVDLWFGGGGRGVFLQDIQFSRQDIQGASAAVFNFNIILGNTVDFDLFNAPVNADAVILVDYIVPDLQVGKVLDNITGRSFLFLLPDHGGAEDIGLGNDGKADLRILIAVTDTAPAGHDVPGPDRPHGIFCIETGDPVICKILGQTSGSGPGRRQDNDFELVLPVFFQAFRQGGKALVIGSGAAGMHGNDLIRHKKVTGRDQLRNADPPIGSQAGQDLLPAGKEFHLPGQDIAPFSPAHHTFPEFHFHGVRVFPDPDRFVQKDQAGFGIEQFQKIAGAWIEVMDVSFQRAVFLPFPGLLTDFSNGGHEPVGFFGPAFVPEPADTAVRFLLHTEQAVLPPFSGQDHF